MKQQYEVNRNQLILLIAIAYLFSILIRLLWVNWAVQEESFFWNGQLMINTNDGYFFASGVQRELSNLHIDNPRVPTLWNYGVVFFTYLITKFTPLSLETVILYLSTFVSSLVVVPIILIARLYGETLWGFFSAILGAVIWSYYNRTMTGYYDTDMFSAMAPMFILYFLIKSTIDFRLRTALYASIAIAIYPFLYDQGRAIIFAIGIIYGIYMVFYHRYETQTYKSLILIFIALTPFKLSSPYEYLLHIMVLGVIYLLLKNSRDLGLKILIYLSGATFLLFLISGDVFGLIWNKISAYIAEGTTEEGGLHYFAVNQTVREAGKVLFFPVPDDMPYQANIAHRMMGSSVGLILALLGYLLLVWRHRAFLVALPLIGIGIFAHWGGLRFTVYAVPVAAMSAIFPFKILSEFLSDSSGKILFKSAIIIGGVTVALLIPNIKHIDKYKVHTVLNKEEIEDLDKLNQIASSKDYTIAWWDYGYPIWFYSDTSTLIDGGKHNEDNFIVSTIMQSQSQTLSANFARLAVETYISSGYKKITKELFENQKIEPGELMLKMEDRDFSPPKKSRDIYLYLPYRMFEIFPTVMLFGNLDLVTGEKLNLKKFIVTSPVKAKGSLVTLSDGTILDLRKGVLVTKSTEIEIKRFVIASIKNDFSIQRVFQNYHPNGYYTVLYLKKYNKIVVMNDAVFNSAYVQMFLLGNYDKELFELVVKSPYSRIYRLKI